MLLSDTWKYVCLWGARSLIKSHYKLLFPTTEFNTIFFFLTHQRIVLNSLNRLHKMGKNPLKFQGVLLDPDHAQRFTYFWKKNII